MDRIGELINNLKQDNVRMLKILSELLNMSQVEAGRIQLNIKKVNLKQIIANAIQAVSGNAREKDVIIKDTSDNNLPEIEADADKTTWVLNNFLTNAIRYSLENNEIVVSIIRQEKTILFPVLEPTRTAPSLFSLLTSNWPWAIIRTTSSLFFWNVHVAYVIRLQYFVAQR